MGVAAAIAGSAVLGAGASIISSSTASSAAKSAANSNNALQSQIYNQNAATLAPYVAQGNSATSAINSLLGLGGGGDDWNEYLKNNPDVLAAYNDGQVDTSRFTTPQAYAQWHYQTYGQNEGRAEPVTDGTSAQNQAFANFRNSTGYQFQLDQGEKALQASLGAKGYLDSGAAQKAALTYGQNVANQSFTQYLGALTGQQGVGLTAASAQAGVGTNYANSVSANNNNAANATGNAALSTGSAINSALGSATSAYSLNAALGSSYTPAAATNATYNPEWGS